MWLILLVLRVLGYSGMRFRAILWVHAGEVFNKKRGEEKGRGRGEREEREKRKRKKGKKEKRRGKDAIILIILL